MKLQLIIKELRDNIFDFKKMFRCVLFAILPASLFYSFSLFGLKSQGFSILEIIRDTAQQSGASSFLGFLSNIGVGLWVSSAAICFFTVFTSSSILKKKHKELVSLTGALSLLLAIDDFFMIHDRYVEQNICYLVYALITITILLRHYIQIFNIAGFSFLAAGLLLATSIFTDLIQSYIPLQYNHTQVIEEGFKFLGSATWLYFNSKISSFR